MDLTTTGTVITDAIKFVEHSKGGIKEQTRKQQGI
jgi:hypothetical protein